jgi:putative Holliday junction resolvase
LRDLPVLMWDERLSTAAVQRQMIAADVSRARRAEQVDSAAAAFMLQGLLDRLSRPLPDP